MDELLTGLIVAAVVVTLVTVVGHGLWVLSAAVLRVLFQIGDQRPTSAAPCPQCGHASGLQQGVCTYCGHETLAAKRRGLKSAIRQLERMRAQRDLEPAECAARSTS